MKIIVTGCAGFIGLHFTKYLLGRAEDTVVGIDCFTYAANVAETEVLCAHPAFTLYREDICDGETMARIFAKERPDAVVHFAAESHVDRSIADAAPFVKTNVLGTQVLLDAAVRHGVSRFHQVSTDEVYGDLPLTGNSAFTERSPINPSSPYSASKAAADLLALAYHHTHGLHVTVSRSSNNYGTHQHGEKLIPTVIKRALSDERIPVYGSGLNVRDWMHVTDHCRAVDVILRHGAGGEIYNVGAGEARSNLDMVRAVLSLLGKSEQLISFVADRKGHDRRYATDAQKLMRTLGWHPTVRLADGLPQIVAWYKERHQKQIGEKAVKK